MRVFPAFWLRDEAAFSQNVLKLEQILPQVGETRIFFGDIWDKDLLNKTKNRCHVLWYPPYSDFNGWVVEPNEIRLTHVVYGEINFLQTYPFDEAFVNSFIDESLPGKYGTKYGIDIISVTPLLDFCLAYNDVTEFQFYSSRNKDGRCILSWENSHEFLKTDLRRNLQYLTGTGQETNFGAIFETHEDKLIMRFHEHCDPSIEDLVVLNYSLSDKESEFFKYALSQAKSCSDTLEPYIK